MVVLAGIGLVRVANGTGGVLVGLFLAAPENASHGFTAVTAGSLGAASFAAELAGAFPMGLLVDAFRPGLLMGIGGLLGAIGTQLFVLGNGTSTFYVARMTEGIAAAASTPATLAHLTSVGEELPERRGSIMSWFELSLIGGFALGAPLAGYLWREWGRSAFSTVAVVYLVGGALMTLGTWGERRRQQTRGMNHLKETLLNRRVLRLVPAWLSMNAIVGLWLSPVLPFLLTADSDSRQYLAGIFSERPERVGLVVLVYAVVFGAGVLSWSLVIDRYSRRRVLAISLIAMLLVCAGLYALNHSGSWPSALRWIVICVLGGLIMVESVFTPAALSLLADVVGGRTGRGAVMAFYSVLLSLGALVGSLIGGVVGQMWAVDGLIAATCALALISMAAVRTIPETAS